MENNLINILFVPEVSLSILAIACLMYGLFSKNNSFRLPENDDVPIIMVGPGTGLAPFKAFLEERDARNAQGKNWLFFGDQTERHDFIYKDILIGMKDRGLINNLSLAFSRDQKEKIYVQNKLDETLEEASENKVDKHAIAPRCRILWRNVILVRLGPLRN